MEKIPHEELIYIKTQILDKIKDSLPTDMADAVFKAFKRLFPQDTMSQPCTCSSAAKYWREIIDGSRNEVTRLLAEPVVEEKQVEENLVTSKNDITFAPERKKKNKKS